jgi:hypothetical protein
MKNDFKWHSQLNSESKSKNESESNSKNITDSSIKRYSIGRTQNSPKDDPMIRDSRRAKYLRDNKFNEENYLKGPENARLIRKMNANVSLAPLNYTPVPTTIEQNISNTSNASPRNFRLSPLT